LRDLVPAVPVEFRSLPAELQSIVGEARFDSISFREARFLQPSEYVPCRTWGSWNAIVQPDGSFKTEVDFQEELLDRQEELQALASWPDSVITDPWARHLVESVEEYRERNAYSLPQGIVRVTLDFGSEDAAFEVFAAIRRGLGSFDGVLRGSGLVFRDAGDRGRLDSIYQWLGQEIQVGRLAKPRLVTEPPATQPSASHFQVLRQELEHLADRYRPLFEAEHAKTFLERLAAGSPRERIETVLSLVLFLAETNAAGQRGDAYAYRVNYAGVPEAILRLARHLREVTLDDWRKLEELVKYLPFFVEIAHLRLRMLAILAEQDRLPAEEIRSALSGIFEDRDDSAYPCFNSDGWIELLTLALDTEALPSEVLLQTVRASVVDAELARQKGYEKRGPLRRCRELLERLEKQR
jgi:hypothetical protein